MVAMAHESIPRQEDGGLCCELANLVCTSVDASTGSRGALSLRPGNSHKLSSFGNLVRVTSSSDAVDLRASSSGSIDSIASSSWTSAAMRADCMFTARGRLQELDGVSSAQAEQLGMASVIPVQTGLSATSALLP